MSLELAQQTIFEAANWLRSQTAERKILIKQTRNLGDTLHITPIARHYKTKFPGCKIAFVVGKLYASVHEFNPDFDKIFTIDHNLGPQERIKLKRVIDDIPDLDLKLCPSIFPFGEVWPSHRWSHANIAHQVWANAEISLPEMLGGRQLRVELSQDDLNFAAERLSDKKYVAFEYHSYSHTPAWNIDKFKRLAQLLGRAGFSCLSLAGTNEGAIEGTMDGRGLSWRRTVAMLARCRAMVGVGSGITMLAAAARPSPAIVEVSCSDAISMAGCGYSSNSHIMNNATAEDVAQFIVKIDRGLI